MVTYDSDAKNDSKKLKALQNARDDVDLPNVALEDPRALLGLSPRTFVEVLSYLDLADILSLARTNKSLRIILMRRSATPIWKRATANVPGLAECQDGLCSPKLAALLFSPWCTECGDRTEDGLECVFPELWLRFCNSCSSKKIWDLKTGRRNIMSLFCVDMCIRSDTRHPGPLRVGMRARTLGVEAYLKEWKAEIRSHQPKRSHSMLFLYAFIEDQGGMQDSKMTSTEPAVTVARS